MRAEQFAGSGTVFRFLLRQYWKRMLIWVLGLVFASVGAGLAYADIYFEPADILGYAITMENPAMKALVGTGYPVEDYHLGAVFANQLFLFSAIAVAIMNVSIMLRSTRTDEEEGRLEVLLSLPVGRSSLVLPPALLLLGANVLLTVVLGSVLSLAHMENMPAEACFLYSATLGAVGLFFAGVALVCAQLAQTSRGAAQLAYGLLTVSYFIRAIGDMQANKLVFLSPLGWLGQAAIFVANRIWPLFALLLGALLLMALAISLNHKRDMGAGILPVRKGRSADSPLLRSPFTLFWRMERMNLVIWAVGLFFMSLAFAAIINDLETYFANLEIMQVILPDLSQSSFAEEMISLVITIFSMFSAIPVINAALRLRKEEESGRLEHLFARPVSRSRIFLSAFLQATIAAITMQTTLAAGFYLGAGKVAYFNLAGLWLACYAYLPALLFTGALALFLIGIRPAFSFLAWMYVLFSFLVVYLGALLEFPDWLKNGSAFHAVPHMPVLENDWTFPLVYVALTVLLLLAGLAAYRRRDLII